VPNKYRKGPGPWCGTAGGYTNHACRCDDCTGANSRAYQAYMDAHPDKRAAKNAKQREARRPLAPETDTREPGGG
jgi:hypothetical protein